MDLYDDIDGKPKAAQIDGWSSSIKMLQTQLAVKKALLPKEATKKLPLITTAGLRTKKWSSQDDFGKNSADGKDSSPSNGSITNPLVIPTLTDLKTVDWEFQDEYDPVWPNEYEKLKNKIQMAKEKEHQRTRREERSNDRKRGRGRNVHNSPPIKLSGFSHRINEEDNFSPPAIGSVSSKGGVAIAPPLSLQEISIANDNGDTSSNVTIPYNASSVAAKIMAKYGFKDGQGLGKKEQGMSMALQVEKTSKRGGRIIHEKDVLMPPPPVIASLHVSSNNNPMPVSTTSIATPTSTTKIVTGLPSFVTESASSSSEPTITEIMKEPSKVVLLRNMVGPGDVDEELEPEVKDECNTKYGEVMNVLIHESFGTVAEEAVKIFVEFKRIESAIKAVVDLNGRFFGGRQVRAGFYNYDKFKNFQLN